MKVYFTETINNPILPSVCSAMNETQCGLHDNEFELCLHCTIKDLLYKENGQSPYD